MLPQSEDEIYFDYELEKQPSLTYKISNDGGRILGYVDNVDAVKQAIYKQLLTERYEHIIYSWNYGVEIEKLYGEDIEYVMAELTSTITDALTYDDRVSSVEDFEFEKQGGTLKISFTVNTICGAQKINTEVNM
jgi:hypothetical protein